VAVRQLEGVAVAGPEELVFGSIPPKHRAQTVDHVGVCKSMATGDDRFARADGRERFALLGEPRSRGAMDRPGDASARQERCVGCVDNCLHVRLLDDVARDQLDRGAVHRHRVSSHRATVGGHERLDARGSDRAVAAFERCEYLAMTSPTRAAMSRRSNFFDEAVAARYDEMSAEMFDPDQVDPAVQFLAGLAWGGDALELGIGTGRLALPLSRRGIRVHGIDLSPQMVARLSTKPGAEQIDVTIGDFATAKVGKRFSLVYLVYNTINNLTTQDAQVECFCNAAEHLEPNGSFVVEVEVPPLQRLPLAETVRPFDVSPTHLGFDEIDVATQQFVSHHYLIEAGRTRVLSMPFRYVWPSELDLMARLAGMTLRERWADWTRAPFTAESGSHISVWQKAATA
jgi:SAM-dependent methyltransferase